MPEKDPYVVVVGGVNIDIGGKPHGPLLERDSNPGEVRVSIGGVGHNIARNLALLGLKVIFLTAVGEDENGLRVIRDCTAAGIDCSRVIRAADARTSVYLFISDEQGDMRLAVSDMAICERITPDVLESARDLLSAASAVVMDANLPQTAIDWLAKHCTAPLFADPVSVAKAGKFRRVLGRLSALKPNRLEAELLSGMAIRTQEDLEEAAARMISKGLRQVYISMGTQGVFAAEPDQSLRVPCCPAEARNMTGAGDAFMAALVWAHLSGLDLGASARAAAAAAAVAVEGADTINPLLSVDTMKAKMTESGGCADAGLLIQ